MRFSLLQLFDQHHFSDQGLASRFQAVVVHATSSGRCVPGYVVATGLTSFTNCATFAPTGYTHSDLPAPVCHAVINHNAWVERVRVVLP